MQDLKNNLGVATTVAPAAHTSDVTGSGVDLQGFEASLVVLQVGTITDGTHTPKLQESDTTTSGDFTDVAAGDLIGTFAALASDTDQKVGYVGAKRYLRVVSTVSGATTGGVYGALILKGAARNAPVS